MPTFVGLDLAWSQGKESGVCWLEGASADEIVCTRLEACTWEMSDLADDVAEAEGDVVAAIDAPLLYDECRWVEREIGRRFGKYQASAHSAHYAVRRGYTAGIDLGRGLEEQHGFDLFPTQLLGGDQSGRYAVEVYPHTIHVRLFDLPERIVYKRGKVAVKKQGLLEYQQHLTRLLKREAPLVLEHDDVQRNLDPQTAHDARGRSLKRLDDTLDGLTCALAAYLLWRDPAQWELLGDEHGYIVAPMRQASG